MLLDDPPVRLQGAKVDLPRLLTARTARRYGLSSRQLNGPRFRTLTRGVYLSGAAPPTLTERSAGALLALPSDAVITGLTALWLHGVEIGSPEPIHAVTATGATAARPGIRLARARLLPPARRRVAHPSAAWVAACPELDLVQAVAAADWLIRLQRVTVGDLIARADAATGRGVRLARRASRLARLGVDSPKETSLRLLLVLAGLPEPACNPVIGRRGAPVGRFDLVLEPYQIAIEYDGDHHRTDPRQWSRDIARHEAAVAAGYVIIRVTNARMANPREIVTAVHARLTERGYRGPAPTFTPEWTRLFEGRRSSADLCT